MGERKDAYRVLVGKLEGKRPCGRHGPRWEVILEQTNRMGSGGVD
jgi:hypothetical protein